MFLVSAAARYTPVLCHILKMANTKIFISIIFLLQVWNTRYTRVHKHMRVFTYRNVCVFIYFCAWSFTRRTVGLKQPLSRRIGEAIAVGI
jgi:hypothetical protein